MRFITLFIEILSVSISIKSFMEGFIIEGFVFLLLAIAVEIFYRFIKDSDVNSNSGVCDCPSFNNITDCSTDLDCSPDCSC